MKILNTTTPHYTRCIKPNRGCRPLTFKKKEVFYPIRLCPLLTKNVSFYRCFLFFSFFFYFFCKVLMQLTACGIVETIHISAAGFPIRYKILCFSFGVFFCYFFVFCWLVTTSVRQNSFQKLRTALRTEGKTFRFQVFLLCPSVSDFGKPTTVKYSSYHVLSLLLVCSPFPSYTLLVNCIPTSLPCLDSSGLVF